MVALSADHCTVTRSGGQDVDLAVWPSYLNRAPTPGGPRSYGYGTEDLRTAADFSEQGVADAVPCATNPARVEIFPAS
jgi:hypothetical protein